MCLAAAFLLAAAGPARADGGDDGGGEVEVYEQAVERGAELFSAREYAAARDAFERAYEIHPNPVLIFNIGSTYRREGEPLQAIRVYERFLELSSPDDPRSQLARETIAVLRTALENERAAQEPKVSEPLLDRRRAEPGAAERSASPEAEPLSPSDRAMPDDRRAGGRTLRLAGIGLGGAGGVAVGLALLDANRAREAEQQLAGIDAWNDAEQQLYQDGESARRRALIFGITGAALVGTGAIVYWLGHRAEADDAGLAVTPYADDTGGGAVVRGRF